MRPLTQLVLLSLASSPLLLSQGLFDLVKPDLDSLREAAEVERSEELKRLQKLAEEEEAKRMEEERKRLELEAIQADPFIDVNTLTLPDTTSGQDVYQVASGDTLGAISRDRYGCSQYFLIIEYWNEIKATKVFIGQEIETPSIATIVRTKGERVLSRYPDEMSLMLKLREDYLAIEDDLRSSNGALNEELKSQLTTMLQSAKKIHSGFLVKRPGVQEYANGLLAQCKNMVDQLAELQKGNLGRKQSRITRVHTCLAYAIRNAMIWGQEGFK